MDGDRASILLFSTDKENETVLTFIQRMFLDVLLEQIGFDHLVRRRNCFLYRSVSSHQREHMLSNVISRNGKHSFTNSTIRGFGKVAGSGGKIGCHPHEPDYNPINGNSYS